jgi:hypothetical protein
VCSLSMPAWTRRRGKDLTCTFRSFGTGWGTASQSSRGAWSARSCPCRTRRRRLARLKALVSEAVRLRRGGWCVRRDPGGSACGLGPGGRLSRGGLHAVSACSPLFLHMCLVVFGVVRASESGSGAGAAVRDGVTAAPGVSSVHVPSRKGWRRSPWSLAARGAGRLRRRCGG